MNNRATKPLLELVHDQEQEIEKYKWIESEKAGRDVGGEAATDGWLTGHFADWKRALKEAKAVIG